MQAQFLYHAQFVIFLTLTMIAIIWGRVEGLSSSSSLGEEHTKILSWHNASCRRPEAKTIQALQLRMSMETQVRILIQLTGMFLVYVVVQLTMHLLNSQTTSPTPKLLSSHDVFDNNIFDEGTSRRQAERPAKMTTPRAHSPEEEETTILLGPYKSPLVICSVAWRAVLLCDFAVPSFGVHAVWLPDLAILFYGVLLHGMAWPCYSIV